jgi:hypothetical protein
VIQCASILIGESDGRQLGFFDVEERLAALSAKGDAFEKLSRLMAGAYYEGVVMQHRSAQIKRGLDMAA